MENITPELELPGFRFHPTEEELIDHYLRKIVLGKKSYFNIIGVLNIYHHDPWDLPGLAKIGEREWYFFVPRDKKSGHGGKPSRTTETGYWKATGSDRTVRCMKEPKKILGLRKTLVFYKGRAPNGCKTDWVMNEYRLPSSCSLPNKLEDIVLCKVYRKATSLKVLEERAAIEDVARASHVTPSCFPTQNTISFCQQQNNFGMPLSLQDVVFKTEEEVAVAEKWNNNNVDSPYLRVGSKKEKLIELQLPKLSGDWNVDTFGNQLRSPWLDNWNPCAMW